MNEFEKACEEADGAVLRQWSGESTIENAVEWIRNSDVATCTLSQKRFISKVRRLKEKHLDDVDIVAENQDGSIVVRVPVSWVHINPPRRVELTDEQRAALTTRLHGLNAAKFAE